MLDWLTTMACTYNFLFLTKNVRRFRVKTLQNGYCKIDRPWHLDKTQSYRYQCAQKFICICYANTVRLCGKYIHSWLLLAGELSYPIKFLFLRK